MALGAATNNNAWQSAFVMWLPIVGLLLGIGLGVVFSVSVPVEFARYTAIAMLAAADSVVGAWRSGLEDKYNNRIFLSGLVVNMLLAASLTFVGDRLGVDLYIAAVVVFGARLFNNLAIIRRHFIK
jgi:small basic protein